MDRRCPMKMEHHPDNFCPLAVMRLKALRNAGRELTEEEESLLPGCPWAVNHQMSNYCFFKYMAEYGADKQTSEIEVAAMNNISVETVKKIEKTGINKIRQDDTFSGIKGPNDREAVMSDSGSEDYKIYE